MHSAFFASNGAMAMYVESVHTLPLSMFSCLKCSKPSLVASQKTSDEESLLDPESSDDLSTACDGGEGNMKPGKHLEDWSVLLKKWKDGDKDDCELNTQNRLENSKIYKVHRSRFLCYPNQLCTATPISHDIFTFHWNKFYLVGVNWADKPSSRSHVGGEHSWHWTNSHLIFKKVDWPHLPKTFQTRY